MIETTRFKIIFKKVIKLKLVLMEIDLSKSHGGWEWEINALA